MGDVAMPAWVRKQDHVFKYRIPPAPPAGGADGGLR
jgi:hypothetical protein